MASVQVKIGRPRKDNKCRLYILIINGRDKKEIPVNFNVHPDNFNSEMGLCTSGDPNYRIINAQISGIISEHETKIQISKLKGEEFVIDGKARLTPTFYDFCYNEVANQTDKAAGTHRHYRVSLRKISEFDSKTRISDITSEWVNRYKLYLLSKAGEDSIFNAFKFLRKMINAGERDGYIKENVFRNVAMPKAPVPQKIRYLNAKELQSFAKAVYRSDMAEYKQCALWQLYACYCGLRISDWRLDDLPNFLLNDKIQLTQTKTSADVTIPLYPKLKQVIQDLIALNLPPFPEYRHNDMLKLVAIRAKVPHDITSHFGRHTFGMYLAESGIGIEVAQKLLGHKSTKETQKYYHLSHSRISDEVLKKLK